MSVLRSLRLVLLQRLVLQWQRRLLLLLLTLLLVLHLVLQRLVMALRLLWEGRIFACLIRTLFLAHIPLEIGRAEQALDGVAALVLAEQLTLSNARAVAQGIANFEAWRGRVVCVATHGADE